MSVQWFKQWGDRRLGASRVTQWAHVHAIPAWQPRLIALHTLGYRCRQGPWIQEWHARFAAAVQPELSQTTIDGTQVEMVTRAIWSGRADDVAGDEREACTMVLARAEAFDDGMRSHAST